MKIEDPDVKELESIYQEVFTLYQKGFHHLLKILQRVQKLGEYSLEEMTDLGFLCREMGKQLDEFRKECVAKQELIGKIIAVILTKKSVADPGIELTVRGRLASGSPDVRQVPVFPEVGSDDYLRLFFHFGITNTELIKRKLVRFHWPEFVVYLTELAEAGKPTPDGLKKTFAKFSTTFRKVS